MKIKMISSGFEQELKYRMFSFPIALVTESSLIVEFLRLFPAV